MELSCWSSVPIYHQLFDREWKTAMLQFLSTWREQAHWLGYQCGRQRDRAAMPSMDKKVFFLYSIQIGSGVHLSSYSLGTWWSCPGCMWPRHEADGLISPHLHNCKVHTQWQLYLLHISITANVLMQQWEAYTHSLMIEGDWPYTAYNKTYIYIFPLVY